VNAKQIPVARELCERLREKRDAYRQLGWDIAPIAVDDVGAALERIEELEVALLGLAQEHEDQAEAWGHKDYGDPEFAEYHARLAASARAALSGTPQQKEVKECPL
jgi:hypothetical protein